MSIRSPGVEGSFDFPDTKGPLDTTHAVNNMIQLTSQQGDLIRGHIIRLIQVPFQLPDRIMDLLKNQFYANQGSPPKISFRQRTEGLDHIQSPANGIGANL